MADYAPYRPTGRGDGQGRGSGARGEPRAKATGPSTPQAAGEQHFFLDDDESHAAGSSRHDQRLSGPEERVLRHTVEQLADCVPVVPLLDVPVLQMVEHLVHVLKNDVEQAIAEPKITLQDGAQPLREPQLAEQLGEVPTILYFLKQKVDIPVHRARLVVVEIFQVSPLHRVPQRFWTLRKSIFKEGFRTFPPAQKSARVTTKISAELGAHPSSPSLSAHHVAPTEWVDAKDDVWVRSLRLVAWPVLDGPLAVVPAVGLLTPLVMALTAARTVGCSFWCGTNLNRGVLAVLVAQTQHRGKRQWVRLASSCCFEARVVLSSAVFFLVRCSWRATWSELGFFWLLGGASGAGECGLLHGTPFVVAM